MIQAPRWSFPAKRKPVDFWQKASEKINRNENVSQKYITFGVDFKLYVALLTYEINLHNVIGGEKLSRNPDGRFVITNHVCICAYVYVSIAFADQSIKMQCISRGY